MAKAIQDRCDACWLHLPLCLCDELERIPSRTRIKVILHCGELRRPSNTGHLLPLALEQASCVIRGLPNTPRLDGLGLLDPDRRNLLLYPDPNATVLNEAFMSQDDRPVTLLVPDGSWRQSRRMFCRDLGHLPVERVCLPEGGGSVYGLRSQTDASHCSTLEAVARAMGLLESLEVRQHLERLMTIFVERASTGRYGDAYSGKLSEPMQILPEFTTQKI